MFNEPPYLAKKFHELHGIAERLRRLTRGAITREGVLEWTAEAYAALDSTGGREVDKLILSHIERQLKRAREELVNSLKKTCDAR